MPSPAQWNKLNEFLLQCGQVHEATNFCNNALRRFGKVVPFDQGRVYYCDEEGRVFDEFLMGVRKSVTRAYHGYYNEVDRGLYDAWRLSSQYAMTLPPPETGHDLGGRVSLHMFPAVDWSKEPHDTKFYREHLEPQGILHSTGFALFDLENRPRVNFCLDRTRAVAFSHDDLVMLALAATHLDNLYRNFYASPPKSGYSSVNLMVSEDSLTERETHVATLVAQGLSTKAIAKKLGIATTTVYKHLSNIHKKLGVSCHAELVAKLHELSKESM